MVAATTRVRRALNPKADPLVRAIALALDTKAWAQLSRLKPGAWEYPSHDGASNAISYWLTERAGVVLSCSCPAGLRRQVCRHQVALAIRLEADWWAIEGLCYHPSQFGGNPEQLVPAVQRRLPAPQKRERKGV